MYGRDISEEDKRFEQIGVEMCRLGQGEKPDDLLTLLRQEGASDVTRTRLAVLLRELCSQDYPAAHSAYGALALASPSLRAAERSAEHNLHCTVVGSRHELTAVLQQAMLTFPADLAIVTGSLAVPYMIDERLASALVAGPIAAGPARIWPGPPLPILAALEMQVLIGRPADPDARLGLLVTPYGGSTLFPLTDAAGAWGHGRAGARIAVHLLGATALDQLLRIWAFAAGTDGCATVNHVISLDDPLLAETDVSRLARCADESELRTEVIGASRRKLGSRSRASCRTRFVGDEAQLVWATAAEADIARGDHLRGSRCLARSGAGADARASLPVCLAMAGCYEAARAEMRSGRIASAAVTAKVEGLMNLVEQTS